jgi:hypothetical protein
MKKITSDEARRETAGKMLVCPFCGATPVAEPWHGGGRRKIMISCENEGCDVEPAITGETPEEALRRWNRRAPATRPNKRAGEVAKTIEARDWMG